MDFGLWLKYCSTSDPKGQLNMDISNNWKGSISSYQFLVIKFLIRSSNNLFNNKSSQTTNKRNKKQKCLHSNSKFKTHNFLKFSCIFHLEFLHYLHPFGLSILESSTLRTLFVTVLPKLDVQHQHGKPLMHRHKKMSLECINKRIYPLLKLYAKYIICKYQMENPLIMLTKQQKKVLYQPLFHSFIPSLTLSLY